MFARGVVYVHAAHLPVPKSLSAKSSVSVTSKLIETKGLQVPYFGHLRKTGGEGVLNIPYLTTSFSPFRSPLSLSSHSPPRLLRLPLLQRNLPISPQFAGTRPAGMRPLLTGAPMPTIDRQELDRLERRNLQLTILSAVFVLILAGGLAAFMYPLVFVPPEENKATMRVAFFGFCALTLLFVGYLFDRQRTFTKLKQHLLAELERNVTLQLQASADLLNSMPDQNHFWDRLSMEFRRALTMEKTMSLVLAKANPATRAAVKDEKGAFSDAAKAIAKRLRPTDSIYHLADDLFGIVLPETDTLNAKRIALRLQEGLQDVRAKFGLTFDLSAYNYPDHVKSSHELEDIVKSLLPEEKEWEVSAEAPVS